MSASETMAKAMEALKSGQDVEQAAYGTSDGAPPTETVEVDVELQEEAAGSTVDEDSHWFFNPEEEEGEEEAESEGSDEEDQSELSEDEDAEDEEEASSKKSAIREVSITDHKGRRKIKVDFNDHDKIEKYIQLAAGFRKMQAERDQLKSQSGKLPDDVQSKLSSLDKLEEAWSGGGRQGIVNVVDMLAREQGGYQEFIKAEYERMRAKAGASPAELERLELQERLEAESREREKLMKQLQEREERTTKQSEEAERKQLRATINPAFEKYRFDGKLGDPEAEAELDEAVWSRALNKLQQLPDNIEITEKVVDQIFKDVTARMRRVFKTQTTKKVKEAVTNQKKAAGEKAAVKAMKGIKSNASKEEFRNDMKSGNWGNALANVLTGKIKL